MNTDSNWGIAFASVIGNSHIEDGLTCQDSCLVEFGDGYGIAIVSDGAGSCENSHIGAEKVCAFSYIHFRQLVEEHQWAVNKQLPLAEAWREIGLEGLFKVKFDLANYSIQEDIDFKSMSCTVMCVVFFPFGLLVAQIGDGRGGYLKDKKWGSLFRPFKGEFANETVFITSKIWESDLIDTYFTFNVLDFPVDAFCLLSDGCEKASFQINLYDETENKYFDLNLPYPNFFNPLVGTLKSLIDDRKSQDEINDLWAKFLTNGNPKFEIETDDKTMLLAINLYDVESKPELCPED